MEKDKTKKRWGQMGYTHPVRLPKKNFYEPRDKKIIRYSDEEDFPHDDYSDLERME